MKLVTKSVDVFVNKLIFLESVQENTPTLQWISFINKDEFVILVYTDNMNYFA